MCFPQTTGRKDLNKIWMIKKLFKNIMIFLYKKTNTTINQPTISPALLLRRLIETKYTLWGEKEIGLKQE